METEIIYNIQAGPYWDWKVAVDLFLGGAGVGALLFAVALDVLFKGRYRRICQTAAWLSPILVTLGLVFLLFKLGRPFNLISTFQNYAPTSPLWWGGIFQPLLVIGSVLYALMWLDSESRVVIRRLLGWLLTPLAIIVGAYHGLLMSVVTARPLWNTGPTVISAILGFMLTGIAAVLLVHLFRMKIAGRLGDQEHVATFLDDMGVVRNTLVIALLMQLITCFLWWLSLTYGTLQDRQSLAAANEAFGLMFWYLGVGMGLALPLVLGGLAVLIGEARYRGFQITTIVLTSAMILVGGFFFRLAVLLSGQLELTVSSLY